MIDFDVGHNIGLYLVEGHLDSNFYSGSIFEISQQKLPCPRLYTSPWGALSNKKPTHLRGGAFKQETKKEMVYLRDEPLVPLSCTTFHFSGTIFASTRVQRENQC
jgi:hypothetical protein